MRTGHFARHLDRTAPKLDLVSRVERREEHTVAGT